MKIPKIVLIFCLLIGFNLQAQKNNALITEIDSFNNVSLDYILSNIDESSEIYYQNLERAQSIDYPKGIADAYDKIRLIEGYQGNIDLSTDLTLKAIKIYESINLKEEAAYLYTELGYGMKNRDLVQAKKYMFQGIKILKAINDSIDLSSAYNNLGSVYMIEGNFDSAQIYIEEGLFIKRILKDTLGIPYSLNNLAGVFIENGKLEKVPALLDESILLRERANNLNGLSENYTIYAGYYSFQGNLNEAIKYHKKSNKVAQEINYKRLMQHNYHQLYLLYDNLGKTGEAFENYKLSEEVEDEILNEENLNKIAELEVEFESVKDKQAIAEQQQEILEGKIKIRNRSILALIIAAVLGLAGIYFFYSSKKQQLKGELEAMQFQKEMLDEKNRISKDLHDNIGSQVTFLISSLDNLSYKNEIPKDRILELNESAKMTLSQLRTTVWAIKESDINLEKFADKIQSFTNQADNISDKLEVKLKTEGNMALAMSATTSIHLFRVIQECVQNALKYASCSQIDITLNGGSTKIYGSVKDNGIGFKADEAVRGNGLRFMEQRIHEIDGKLSIESSEFGTIISFEA